MRQPQCDIREGRDQRQRDYLEGDERHAAALDFLHRQFRRGRALDLEQRKAEGRRQKAGLQIDRHQYGEPVEQIGAGDMIAKIKPFEDRQEDRQDDQRDLDPVEKETEQEYHRHQNRQQSSRAEPGSLDHLSHRIVAAKGAEHE